MKVLFTADIHIKLGQKNVPIEWAKNRYEKFIKQLSVLQQTCDLLVLGGDVFDRMPTMDELEVYFDLIASISIPCIIYAGNHEAELSRLKLIFSAPPLVLGPADWSIYTPSEDEPSFTEFLKETSANATKRPQRNSANATKRPQRNSA